MAKKFFYVCAGILLLAGAYAVGAGSVVAQVGFGEVVAVDVTDETGWPATTVFTTSGDIYSRVGRVASDGETVQWNRNGVWTYLGNALSAPVASEGANLGNVKSQYR